MFLGLIVFLAAWLAVTALVFRAARWLFRSLAGKKQKEDRADSGKDAEPVRETKEKKKAGKEVEHEVRVEPEMDEEARNRFAAATEAGITEAVCEADVDALLNPVSIASRLAGKGSLTQLEFENRGLAGEDFKGFNLIVDRGERVVLTCCGQAVASITKVEIPAAATINGVEVMGSAPGVRINTFPPTLQDGMSPSDVERMLEAREAVIACGSDSDKALEAISCVFSSEDNTRRFKAAVDGKIREKMSAARSVDGDKKSLPKKIRS